MDFYVIFTLRRGGSLQEIGHASLLQQMLSLLLLINSHKKTKNYGVRNQLWVENYCIKVLPESQCL